MNRYDIGHAAITVMGFMMGAVLAMIIAPGNMLVVIGTGIVFGFSARAIFDQEFGGDWFWFFGRRTPGKTVAVKPSIRHR